MENAQGWGTKTNECDWEGVTCTMMESDGVSLGSIRRRRERRLHLRRDSHCFADGRDRLFTSCRGSSKLQGIMHLFSLHF